MRTTDLRPGTVWADETGDPVGTIVAVTPGDRWTSDRIVIDPADRTRPTTMRMPVVARWVIDGNTATRVA